MIVVIIVAVVVKVKKVCKDITTNNTAWTMVKELRRENKARMIGKEEKTKVMMKILRKRDYIGLTAQDVKSLYKNNTLL